MTQFLRRKTLRLIRVYTVCLQEFLWKYSKSDIHQKPLNYKLNLPNDKDVKKVLNSLSTMVAVRQVGERLNELAKNF